MAGGDASPAAWQDLPAALAVMFQAKLWQGADFMPTLQGWRGSPHVTVAAAAPFMEAAFAVLSARTLGMSGGSSRSGYGHHASRPTSSAMPEIPGEVDEWLQRYIQISGFVVLRMKSVRAAAGDGV